MKTVETILAGAPMGNRNAAGRHHVLHPAQAAGAEAVGKGAWVLDNPHSPYTEEHDYWKIGFMGKLRESPTAEGKRQYSQALKDTQLQTAKRVAKSSTSPSVSGDHNLEPGRWQRIDHSGGETHVYRTSKGYGAVHIDDISGSETQYHAFGVHKDKGEFSSTHPSMTEARKVVENALPRTASDFAVAESDDSRRRNHERFNASNATPTADILHCACAVSDLIVMAGQPWVQDQETSFMYMPAGRHTIIAGFRGKAIELTVEVVPEDAAKVLSASMEQLQASQPKQRLFGCIEHAEKDASVWAKKFEARPDGVYLCAEPSKLGADHVNGRIHRSWSPSFLTDADYAKARLSGDIYQFPDGVKGSKSNPAKITGCAFCLGTLTNKPAFREMSPVMAREAVDAVVMAAGTSGPTPLNPQPFLDFLSQLRLAHWAADTSTEEHETLGELYEQLESLVDEFVEQSLGAEGTTVVPSAASLPELLESGCALVQAELDQAPSEGVKNTLAEMCGALDKARYLLKAKDQDMNADTITAGGTSAGAKKGWEKRHSVGDVVRRIKTNEHGQGAVGSLHTVTQLGRRLDGTEIIYTRPHEAPLRKVGMGYEYTEDSGSHEEFEKVSAKTADPTPTAADVLRATWSPQARAAAAEARREHVGLSPATEAMQASSAAQWASNSASTKEGHDIAHFLHKKAAELHEKAHALSPDLGHKYQAGWHEKQAAHHEKEFKKLTASTPPTVADILSPHSGANGQPAV